MTLQVAAVVTIHGPVAAVKAHRPFYYPHTTELLPAGPAGDRRHVGQGM